MYSRGWESALTFDISNVICIKKGLVCHPHLIERVCDTGMAEFGICDSFSCNQVYACFLAFIPFGQGRSTDCRYILRVSRSPSPLLLLPVFITMRQGLNRNFASALLNKSFDRGYTQAG